MNQKTIESDDLREWYANEEVEYASSSREAKRISCTLAGRFRVYVGGELTYSGRNLMRAVSAYNEATKRYVDPFKDFVL